MLVLPVPGGPTKRIVLPLTDPFSFDTAINSRILYFTSSIPKWSSSRIFFAFSISKLSSVTIPKGIDEISSRKFLFYSNSGCYSVKSDRLESSFSTSFWISSGKFLDFIYFSNFSSIGFIDGDWKLYFKKLYKFCIYFLFWS